MHALGLGLLTALAVLAFVGLAWATILGMVVALEPLSRRGRLAGYALEGALHALLPFALVTAAFALLGGLPEGGALHLRALPLLALLGALVGVLRWVMSGRGALR